VTWRSRTAAPAPGRSRLHRVGSWSSWPRRTPHPSRESKVDHVALVSAPKPVTVVAAQGTTFRESRMYIGTLRHGSRRRSAPSSFPRTSTRCSCGREPSCIEESARDARLPQRERVEPGGDGRGPAIDARQRALGDESRASRRCSTEASCRPTSRAEEAQSAAELAQLASQRAKMVGTNLEVSDCILRAPFDGEIATRSIDPGAFVRPGTSLVAVVDRTTVRMTFDVPEGTSGWSARHAADGARPGDGETSGHHLPPVAERRRRYAHRALRSGHPRSEAAPAGQHDGGGAHRGGAAAPGDGGAARRRVDQRGQGGHLVVEGAGAQGDVRVEGSSAGRCSSTRPSRRVRRGQRGTGHPRDGDAVAAKQVVFTADSSTAPTKEPSP